MLAAVALAGLQDIVLHPDFARNHLLYLSYSKNRLPALGVTLAIARARYENGRLLDVKDILVTEAWNSPLGTYGGRMIFGPDGMLYISVGDRDGTTSNDISSARPQAQKLDSGLGKQGKISADGTVNLMGALRRSMATTGYSDIKEFQKVEVVVAPYGADSTAVIRSAE